MKRIASLFAAGLVLLAANVSWGQDFWEPADGKPFEVPETMTITQNGSMLVFADDPSRLGGLGHANVFISLDNGLTWTESQAQVPASNTDILISPNGHLFLWGDNDSLYRSTNEGSNWTAISDSMEGNLAIDSTGKCFRTYHSVDVKTRIGIDSGWVTTIGIAFSTDEGFTWDSVFSVVDTVPLFSGDHRFIVVDKNNEKFIIAGTDYNVVFKSFDGIKWTQVQCPNIGALGVSPSGGLLGVDTNHNLYHFDGNSWSKIPGHYPDPFYVAPIVSDHAGNLFSLAQTINSFRPLLFRSTDSGLTWAIIDSDVRCIAFSPNALDTRLMVSGNIYSVYVSSDFGNHWKTISHSINYNNNVGMSLVALDNGPLLASTYFRLFSSQDDGRNWEFTSGTEGDSAADWGLASCHECVVVQNYSNGNFYRSSDGGASWEAANYGLPGPDSTGYYNYQGPYSDQCGHLFCYSGNFHAVLQLYYSSDCGESWQRAHSHPDYHLSGFASNSSCAIFTGYDTIYKSQDNGGSWLPISAMPDSSHVANLVVDRKDNIFAITDAQRIYRSMDDGASWNFEWELTNTKGPYRLAIDSEQNIFIGCLSGEIFRSSNDGLTWDRIDSDDLGQIESMVVDKNGYIFVGTNDRGIFRSVKSTLSAVHPATSHQISLMLAQNSPNPFPQSTSISFTLPTPGYATLSLFDATGRQLPRIASGYFTAGEHSAEFQRGTLPAGVYFYRLEAGGQSVTRAMIVAGP